MNRRTIRYATWKRIADLYDPLSAAVEPGPSRLVAVRAEKKGWPTPMDWEVVDIDHPDQIPAAPPTGAFAAEVEERQERVRELTRLGRSAAEIALQMGLTVRMVERDRAAVREASFEESIISDRSAATNVEFRRAATELRTTA